MSKFRFEPTITELRSNRKWSNEKQSMKLSNYKIPISEVGIWKENGWVLSEDENTMSKGEQIVEIHQKIIDVSDLEEGWYIFRHRSKITGEECENLVYKDDYVVMIHYPLLASSVPLFDIDLIDYKKIKVEW